MSFRLQHINYLALYKLYLKKLTRGNDLRSNNPGDFFSQKKASSFCCWNL